MKLQQAFKLSTLVIALAAVNSTFAAVSINGVDVAGTTPTESAQVSIDNLPIGDKSIVNIDKSGVSVDVVQQKNDPKIKPAGTTLKYETVVDKNDLVLDTASGLYKLKANDSILSYEDKFTITDPNSKNAQIYTPEKLQFDSSSQTDVTERTDSKEAVVYYDADGFFVKVDDVKNLGTNPGTPIVSEKTQDTIIVGRENTGDENALTVRKDKDGKITETVVTAEGITTEKLTIGTTEITANFLTSKADTAVVNSQLADKADKVELATKADTAVVNSQLADKADKVDLAAKADTAVVNGQLADKADKVDLAAKADKVELATKADTAVVNGQLATKADTAVVNGQLADKADKVDLAAKADKAYVNDVVDTKLTGFNSRVNQLNSRINDVEKTAYRGVAIALAAQQQIPNIGAGQFAVFGGVGHYEGETAGAIGIANVFADGRTSLSAAIGVAGGNEVGGRVGVSYVFGGK